MPDAEKHKRPLLSIITINWNNADGLQKTIQSVMSQKLDDYSELEYIIVDGASKDASVEVIQNGIRDSKFSVDWKSEPDTGIYNAMNKGIKKAHGEYCLFLNSGDWLFDENTISRFFTVYSDFISSKDTIFYGKCKTIKDGKISGSIVPEKEISLDYLFSASINHPASFIPIILLKNHYYDENLRIVSDWKLFLIGLLENYSFKFMDDYISYFDLSGISATNSDNAYKERDKTLKELLPEYVYKNELKNALCPTNEWNYYGKCLYQKKCIYKFCLFVTKSVYKLLRTFHILKRIDI